MSYILITDSSSAFWGWSQAVCWIFLPWDHERRDSLLQQVVQQVGLEAATSSHIIQHRQDHVGVRRITEYNAFSRTSHCPPIILGPQRRMRICSAGN